MQQKHVWQFFRAGAVDQAVLNTGQDIAHIRELDQKLWVALACPTRGIEFDSATLDLIDEDKDGRIRPPELIATCEWAVARVADPQVLADGGDVLKLSSINQAHEEGVLLHAEARRVLALAGEADADAISLEQMNQRLESLAAMRFNGDGIVSAATAGENLDLAALIERIAAAYGSVEGVDAVAGIGREQAQAFFDDLRAQRDWRSQIVEGGCGYATREQALAAAQALQAVQAKGDDFFTRARLVAFDAKAEQALNPSVEGYAALSQGLLGHDAEPIAALPLAPVAEGRALPLLHGVNPAWAAALAALREQAVAPLWGEEVVELDAAQWEQLKALLAPCQQWLGARPASPLGELEVAEIAALLDSGLEAALMDLLDQDEGEREHGLLSQALTKLIRLQRDLLPLLNNFISFPHFYRREGAAFQAGTLFLDGRSCDLTVEVADAGAHAALAGLAKTYLAYCDCRRAGVSRTIVAAFTAGDVDFLFVGRNGVFYDRQGQDWDASIVKLIENPTSIGQAFFSPYKKFLRMIEEQVAKRAAAKEEVVSANLGDKAGKLANTPAQAVAAEPRKTDVGTVAALGVALGSISAVLVGIFGKFIELGPWIPVALLGMIAAISGPSMMIAWLKLRQRSLGPILDASGWAINGRMKINLPLGESLSQRAKIPAGAKRSASDPYAQGHGLRNSLLVLAALALLAALAWRMHWLDGVMAQGWPPQAEEAAAEAAGEPSAP
ncbi:hypothetical protein [Comamonas composti]|uniref:hypothetical protein n=1 Tax=Comamonas composti TaxID=408558 RepID=UPI000414DC9F|nr:hypothetical protein [Comamonas composti]